MTEKNKEQAVRQLLVDYGKKLVDTGLVQGTWGNISIRLDDEYMMVTPSGLDYQYLTTEDMVKVNINTLAYDGQRKPTSEKGLHAAVLRKRSEIGAVIHTHSKYCCIFAAARVEMPIEHPEARNIFGEKVAVSSYGFPGTEELVEETMKGLGENNATIMANHGMMCCGKDIAEAFDRCKLLEQCGKEYIESRYVD
ncbi:L-fuculose-phosphate aldolase [Clostridiales Family XIII bacterium PM5-7]